MLGFVPGFAYLGDLDARIATSRRDTPRPRVPAGTVAIGGAQTGVYPLETPGGWQLIGRTPLRMFTPDSEPPSSPAGDTVRFVAISRAEFDPCRNPLLRIRVLKPGMLTTLQDSGATATNTMVCGSRRDGSVLAPVANMLVGNPGDEATLDDAEGTCSNSIGIP